MRNLILLRGAAGCGKSTWIKDNNLIQYTIGADDIRLLFQSPVTNIEGNTEISSKNDGKVWEFIFNILEERMKRGELSIIDATHSRVDLINRYKKLCQEYRYRCTVVKFDVPLDKILEQNKKRDIHKQVPEDAIANMVSRINSQATPSWCSEIKPDEFLNTFGAVKCFDFNQYKEVVHIGDIHGCFEPLKKYFDEYPFDIEKFYIFIGDYIDRGIQNKDVLEFLFDLASKKNVLLLEGNHERWLKFYGEENFDEIRSKEFLKYTVPQIEMLDKKDIREFCRKFGQMGYYEFRGKRVFCSHAGVPILPTPFTATEEFVKGVGKYEDYLKVEESWNKNNPDIFQIHGHRNTDNTSVEYLNTFNLCDTIEFGGNLRIVELNESGFNTRYYKNNTFFINENIPEKMKIEDEDQLLQSMLHNKLIHVKQLTDHIVSLNFTREAFYDKKWNDLTSKARGLFVNLETKSIVARAYEKFFNIGESDSVKPNELRRTMVFPAKAYLKYNGYLGIVGYNDESDDIFISTKSTNHGPMQEVFENLLIKYVDRETLKNFVKNNNVSLIFEVIDPINDPHIIEYYNQNIILLDCIDRTWDFGRSLNVYDVAKELGLSVKEECAVLKDYNQFYQFVTGVDQENYQYDEDFVEGFVIEDSAGFMVKVKSGYYKFWKAMRGVLQTLAAGRTLKLSWLTTPEQNLVYAFMKSKGRDYLKGKSIIDIRKEYLDP